MSYYILPKLISKQPGHFNGSHPTRYFFFPHIQPNKERPIILSDNLRLPYPFSIRLSIKHGLKGIDKTWSGPNPSP